MSRRTMVIGAALVTAALVIPVTLVLAKGNVPGTGGDVASQTVRWTTRSYNAPKKWHEVPDVGFLGDNDDAHSITVSAEMKKGSAKFRVISSGHPTPPGPIEFSGKGSNSFTFGYDDGCYFHPGNSLEWKRVGKHKATANTISVLDLNGGQPCL